jgi:hypothetical protein
MPQKPSAFYWTHHSPRQKKWMIIRVDTEDRNKRTQECYLNKIKSEFEQHQYRYDPQLFNSRREAIGCLKAFHGSGVKVRHWE